jgi:hypothetical protein
MFQKPAGAPVGDFREVHSLSRLASTRFAGSAFGLEAGKGYDFKLTSAAFAADQFLTVTTRADVFPVPSGATYHVSPSNGNDANSGTSSNQAFRTLGKALSVATAGSRVLLYSGVYYEGDLDAPRSGTAVAPIVIENAPGTKPVLNGADNNFAPIWTLYDAANHVYRTPWTGTPENAYLNGGQFFHYLVLADLLSLTWNQPGGYHVDGSFFYARFPGDTPPGTNVVTVPAHTTGITLNGRSFIQIRGLEFCYFGRDEFHRGVYIDGGASNLIDRCFFHHNGVGVAFKRAANFNTVQHCTFTEWPVVTWTWSAVKEGGGDYEAGGIVVYGSAQTNRGNVIRFCTFTNLFDGSHLYSDDAAGPTENMDFHNNVIDGCGDDGIETDGAGSNCRIYFNRFHNFLTGVSVAPCAIGPTYIFRNTLSGWHTADGFEGYPFKFNVSSSLPIEWVYLYHNSCFTDVAGQDGFLFKQYSKWTNVISRNNIFSGTAYALDNWDTPNPASLDYDDLYTTRSNQRFAWGSARYDTIAAFAAGTGQETHGLSVPPGFVNSAGRDFYLNGNSGLIDRGVVIPGVNDMFMDTGPDIGVFEFGARADDILVGPTGAIIEWQVGVFSTFQLQYTTNLSQAVWNPIGSATLAGRPVLRTTDVSPTDSQRFYRLQRVAP